MLDFLVLESMTSEEGKPERQLLGTTGRNQTAPFLFGAAPVSVHRKRPSAAGQEHRLASPSSWVLL